MMVLGLAFCFFGLKLYHPTLFLIGFLTGFGFNVVIMGEFVIHYDSESIMAYACLINAVLFGCLTGYATYAMPRLGYFTLGMWMGIVITLLCNNAFLYKIQIGNQFVVLWVTISVLSVVMGLLSCFFYKHCVMICTGFIGSYLLIRPCGWMIGSFPNELQITKELKYGTINSVPSLFYLYFALILLIGAIGIKFQYSMYYSRRHQEEDNDLQLYLGDSEFVDNNQYLLDIDDEDLTTKQRDIKQKLIRMQKNVEKEKKRQSKFVANADKMRRREKGEDGSSDEEQDDEENSDDEDEGEKTNRSKQKSKDFGLIAAMSKQDSRKKSVSKSKKQYTSPDDIEKKGGKNGKSKYHDDDTPDSADNVMEKSNKKFSQVFSGFKKANKNESKEDPDIEMDDLSESNYANYAYGNDDKKKDQSEENSDNSDSDNEKNKKKNAKNAAKLAKQSKKKK